MASTTRSGVPRAMRPVAMPEPARTLPSGLAADSSARTTLVPIAMMRRPRELRLCDLRRDMLGDAVGLVEGKARIKCGIAGRRNARGMGERCEAHVAPSPGLERAPVERKACRWRLEGDRCGGNLCPNIPQCQRLGNMRVLDWPPVLRQSCKRCRTGAKETQLEQARMVEKALDHGFEWAEFEAIAWRQRRRRRPLFRAHAVIARAENNRHEAGWVGKRQPACQADFDRLVPVRNRAAQAGWQRRGVIGDDQVAGIEQRREPARGRSRILPSASTMSSLAERRPRRSATIMPAPR